MTVQYFSTPDATHFCIGNLQQLTSKEAACIREELQQLTEAGVTSVYVDTTGVQCVDLGGINEIIHTHFVMEEQQKQFVFAYRQHSEVEKWVATTGLDKFVATALLPA